MKIILYIFEEMRDCLLVASRQNQTKNMKNNFLKIVVTSKNQTQYFCGDGFWFGRISKQKFESKLAQGFSIWEKVNHAPENVVRFTK